MQIQGSDAFYTTDPCADWGGSCPRTTYDSGSVTITVNGASKSTAYGSSSSPSSLASALASAIAGDNTFPATAYASGGTVYLTARAGGVSSNYAYSFSTASGDPADFPPGSSFGATTAGPNFTGAMDACPTGSPSFACPIITTYTYNALDLLTNAAVAAMGPVNGTMFPAQPRTYAYDSLGRLTSSGTPESGTTYLYYTTVGGSTCAADASAVCYKTDARGITSTYTYDGLNRVSLVTYSDTTPQVSLWHELGLEQQWPPGLGDGGLGSGGRELYLRPVGADHAGLGERRGDGVSRELHL